VGGGGGGHIHLNTEGPVAVLGYLIRGGKKSSVGCESSHVVRIGNYLKFFVISEQ